MCFGCSVPFAFLAISSAVHPCSSVTGYILALSCAGILPCVCRSDTMRPQVFRQYSIAAALCKHLLTGRSIAIQMTHRLGRDIIRAPTPSAHLV